MSIKTLFLGFEMTYEKKIESLINERYWYTQTRSGLLIELPITWRKTTITNIITYFSHFLPV